MIAPLSKCLVEPARPYEGADAEDYHIRLIHAAVDLFESEFIQSADPLILEVQRLPSFGEAHVVVRSRPAEPDGGAEVGILAEHAREHLELLPHERVAQEGDGSVATEQL